MWPRGWQILENIFLAFLDELDHFKHIFHIFKKTPIPNFRIQITRIGLIKKLSMLVSNLYFPNNFVSSPKFETFLCPVSLGGGEYHLPEDLLDHGVTWSCAVTLAWSQYEIFQFKNNSRMWNTTPNYPFDTYFYRTHCILRPYFFITRPFRPYFTPINIFTDR